MVAQLLEFHQGGQDQPLALDSLGIRQGRLQLRNHLLVEDHLLPAQGRIGLHLDFFREVRDHRFVGFEPPENIRAHHFPEPGVPRRIVFQGFGEPDEFGLVPQEAGVEEVEQGPEVSQPVFDGRAGEGDAVDGGQALSRPGSAWFPDS